MQRALLTFILAALFLTFYFRAQKHETASLKAPELPAPLPTPSINPQADQDERKVLVLYRSGNYYGTLALIDTLLREKKANTIWLEQQRLTALVAAGWLDLKTKHCQRALERFKTVLSYKKDPAAVLGKAKCLMELNENAEASATIDELFEAQPAFATVSDDAHIIKANFLEANLDFDQALLHWRYLAQTDTPDLRTFAQNRLRQCQELQGLTKEQAFSDRFNLVCFDKACLSDQNQILSYLEDSINDLVTVQGFAYPQGRIDVILYDQALFAQLFTGLKDWVGGFYNGAIHVPIPANTNLEKQKNHGFAIHLKHELVHALLPRHIPVWLNEGMAQYYSCPDQTCEGQWGVQIMKHEFLPQSVFETSMTKLDRSTAMLAYRQSLFLFRSFDDQSAVVSHVLQHGASPSDEIIRHNSPYRSFQELLTSVAEKWQHRD